MDTPRRQLRTANYSHEARLRLGEAVAQARTADGFPRQTQFIEFAKANGVKLSIRSLGALEAGEAGVGQAVLFAVGHLLSGWTEDTPRLILDGGEIPRPPVPPREKTADESPAFTPTAKDRARWRSMTIEQITDEGEMIGRTISRRMQREYLKAALAELDTLDRERA